MVRLALAPRPTAATAARHRLSDLPLGRALEVARLLLTELVANAVRHAAISEHDKIEVRVLDREPGWRIEVRDAGTFWSPRADPSAPGGWGLVLVDQLSARWGIERDAGTCVWFELD